MSKRPSKELKLAQKEWYEKLRKEGFKDIERHDWDDSSGFGLKRFDSFHFIDTRYGDIDKDSFQAKSEYFRLATHFLNEHTFEDPLDRYIWEMHSEGKSIRDIEKSMKAAKTKIHARIKAVERLMINKASGKRNG